MLVVKTSAKLISHTPEPERLIELAARQCYNSRDKITATSAAEFCSRILKSGHFSVLEMANATFDMVVDRGVLGELTRHRIGMSYAVQSTRFCDYSKDKYSREVAFVQPQQITPAEMDIWRDACINAEQSYMALREGGVKPEIARSVLPMCLATPLTVNGNFRAWLHFLKLRVSEKAHPDIRVLAMMVWEQLHDIAPSIFEMTYNELLALPI